MLSFSMSGQGREACPPILLSDAQALALQCGFAKPGVAADKPLAQRVDMAAFFKALGVTSLSSFTAAFCEAAMTPPVPGQTPPPRVAKAPAAGSAAAVAATALAAKEAAVDVTQYDALAAGYEALKWRIIPRPGGATLKPDDYYPLWAAQQQVEKGDCVGEKPMWGATGGLDFDGRERHDAWLALKGLDREAAIRAFCVAHARVMEHAEENFRKF